MNRHLGLLIPSSARLRWMLAAIPTLGLIAGLLAWHDADAATPPAGVRLRKNCNDPAMPALDPAHANTKPVDNVAKWKAYVSSAENSLGGFLTNEGGVAPTMDVIMFPHKTICSTKHMGAAHSGQIIGKVIYIGGQADNEYGMKQGDQAYVLVRREKKDQALLIFVTKEGTELYTRPYVRCHANSHDDKPVQHVRFGWANDEKTCEKEPQWASDWNKAHPHTQALHLHDDTPWFACDEGCCHIVES